jgi:multicomponent Na+:H+ antiporter subunit F
MCVEMIETAYNLFLTAGCIFLAVTIFFCLLRAILGPRLTDRVIAVNIISCKVIVLFSMLAILFDEFYLLDVSIVYALIGFLTVVVLSKVYISACSNRQYQQRLRCGDEK